jgi:hypothetical protein
MRMRAGYRACGSAEMVTARENQSAPERLITDAAETLRRYPTGISADRRLFRHCTKGSRLAFRPEEAELRVENRGRIGR